MVKWLVRLVLLCVLTSAAWAGWHALQGKTAANLRTTGLSRGPLTLAISATGRLAPITQVLVGSEVSGTVNEVLVNFNDHVSRGQTIARIRPEYYQAQCDQAQAELAKARAQVRQLEVAEQETRRECERLVKLRTTGAVTEQECDVKQAAYDSARAAVAVGQAAVRAARSQLELAQYQLKRAVITSPIDGIVLDRRVDIGQTVAASLQTPVLFVLAEDLGQMELLADVSEADVGYLCAGQPVSFTVNAYRDRTFSGRVKQVRNQPHTVGDVVNYTVVIRVANDDYLFRPGMPADLSIQIVRQDEVTKIANAALRFRPPLPPDVIRQEVEQLAWPEPPPPLRVTGTAPATPPSATPALGAMAASLAAMESHECKGTSSGATGNHVLSEVEGLPASASPRAQALPPPIAPAKGTLWQYAGQQWKPVPVWTLYTDNRETAVAFGADVDPEVGFVTEIGKDQAGQNSLQKAFYLANPENRKL